MQLVWVEYIGEINICEIRLGEINVKTCLKDSDRIIIEQACD